VIARRSVWSDPEVVELARAFVPVTDEVHRLQTGSDPECRLFQTIAEQGHYAGQTYPSITRQGTYAAAPSGVLLASINSNDAKAMAGMLRRALERWDVLSREERLLPNDLAGETAQIRRAEQVLSRRRAGAERLLARICRAARLRKRTTGRRTPGTGTWPGSRATRHERFCRRSRRAPGSGTTFPSRSCAGWRGSISSTTCGDRHRFAGRGGSLRPA
jgi:hypothetical protein